MTEVEEIGEEIRILETELSDAQFAQEDADTDLALANKVMKITASKRAQILDLIFKFESDLEALL